jgi:hypothetical protein
MTVQGCRTCATMEVHERLLADNKYRDAQEHANRAAMRFRAEAVGNELDQVVTIPVVFHIVLPDPNIVSDEQIATQIAVLNADYNKSNEDFATAPAVFSEHAGNANIRFVLASKDPQGNPFSGIERKTTTAQSFSSDDGVKSEATGGANAWPADKYLNIWVCQLGQGLLGYAQFPGGPAETDGVALLHSAVGTTGTARAPFNKGRSATHEIGHWLNLRHIWGDRTDCTGDDFVDDTPRQGAPNFGKPKFPHSSCGNEPDGDMFVDYMDYVDDDAMVMFTKGQVDRMRSALKTMRSSFLSAA